MGEPATRNRSVGGLVLADPARTFAKMRSHQNENKHHVSGSAHVCSRRYAKCAHAPRVTKSIEARTQELPRLCRLFAGARQHHQVDE